MFIKQKQGFSFVDGVPAVLPKGTQKICAFKKSKIIFLSYNTSKVFIAVHASVNKGTGPK